MPYIPENERPPIDAALKHLPANLTPGQINYLITQVSDQKIEDAGLSYATINDLIGVLECAKLELYRRIAGPYEDLKVSRNGDAYPNAQQLLYRQQK